MARIRHNRIRFIAWPLRPLAFAIWVVWGFYLYVTHALLFFTCRKKIHGLENIGERNYIFCGWHECVVPFLSAHLHFDRPMVHITNDAWFMPPIHFLLQRMGGVIVAIGSPGSVEPGMQSALTLLSAGFSTMITPDGPNGPPRCLKKGVLMMAAKSGVPIMPVRAIAHRAWQWRRSWDGKRVPLPFSTIEISFGQPIFVDFENLELMRDELSTILSGASPPPLPDKWLESA